MPPLDGIRVVDLSRLVAGNMLSLQLADQGAEVIKVEDPRAGDPLRAWRVKGLSPALEGLCAEQEESGAEPAAAGRARRAAGSAGEEPCADRELPPGHAGADGSRPRRAARAQSRPDHRAHHRLRPGRAVSRPARLRHAGRGDVGVCLEERLRRPPAGAAAAGAGRHGGGAVRRLRGDDRAARRRAWRQGTGDRSAAARSDHFRSRARCGDLSRVGREAAAHRQPFADHVAAQRLCHEATAATSRSRRRSRRWRSGCSARSASPR